MASRGRRKSVGVVEMAQDLGVSTATVSRALNSNPSVRRELADRIRAHAEARGYVANRLARALVGEHQPGVRRVRDPVRGHPGVLGGRRRVRQAAVRAGTQMILAITENDAAREYSSSATWSGPESRGW